MIGRLFSTYRSSITPVLGGQVDRLDRHPVRFLRPVLGLSRVPGSLVRRVQRGENKFLECPLARVGPVDHLTISEPVQSGLAVIAPDEHVVAAPVVRDGVKELVNIRHGVHDPLEGLMADSAILGCVLE